MLEDIEDTCEHVLLWVQRVHKSSLNEIKEVKD